jgi:hypothetical protein
LSILLGHVSSWFCRFFFHSIRLQSKFLNQQYKLS